MAELLSHSCQHSSLFNATVLGTGKETSAEVACLRKAGSKTVIKTYKHIKYADHRDLHFMI